MTTPPEATATREATQRFATLDVLMSFVGQQLTPEKVNELHAALCSMMVEGPCAWAFQASAGR